MNLTKISNLTNAWSNGSIDVWFAEISDATTTIEQQTETLLSDSEEARLCAIKNLYKRREFLLGRALMRHGLSHRFDQKEGFWNFRHRPNYAPEITNLPQAVYTSLSHSKGLIGFVISEKPVGLDLEIINSKRNIEDIAEVTMTKGEIYYLNQHPAQKEIRFYELWCCKEAYYKSLSPLDQVGIRFSSLSIKHIDNDNSSGHFLLNNIGEYVVAIATSVWPVLINQQILQTGKNSPLELALRASMDSYYRPGQRDKS